MWGAGSLAVLAQLVAHQLLSPSRINCIAAFVSASCVASVLKAGMAVAGVLTHGNWSSFAQCDGVCLGMQPQQSGCSNMPAKLACQARGGVIVPIAASSKVGAQPALAGKLSC